MKLRLSFIQSICITSLVLLLSIFIGVNASKLLPKPLTKAEKLHIAYQLADCDDEPILSKAYQNLLEKENLINSESAIMADITECKRISACDRDAEQLQDGTNFISCNTTPSISDLDLGEIGSQNNYTALSFTGWNIPPGATITSADIQFAANANSIRGAAFTITGEAMDNSVLFDNIKFFRL